MPTFIDRLVNRIPGSTNTKAFVSAVLLTGLAAYSFPPGKPGEKKGHSYFSHEKPEVVAELEKRAREQKRLEREQNKE